MKKQSNINPKSKKFTFWLSLQSVEKLKLAAAREKRKPNNYLEILLSELK